VSLALRLNLIEFELRIEMFLMFTEMFMFIDVLKYKIAITILQKIHLGDSCGAAVPTGHRDHRDDENK
jgi:hypothetical protein